MVSSDSRRAARQGVTILSVTALLTGCVASEPPLTNRGSIACDGSGGRASLGTVGAESPLLLAGSRFSIAAWFRQEPGGDTYQRIIDKSDGRVGRNGWALGADGASGQVHLYAHDGRRGADFSSSRGSYRTGRWHHVVAVARSRRYEIWIDGERDAGAFFEDGSFTLPGAAATDAAIGNWNHEAGRAWKGNLDEVAVWSTDLSPREIVRLHESRGTLDLRVNGGGYRSAASLAGWWRMEPGAFASEGILRDASGGGRDASISFTGARGGPPRVVEGEVP